MKLEKGIYFPICIHNQQYKKSLKCCLSYIWDLRKLFRWITSVNCNNYKCIKHLHFCSKPYFKITEDMNNSRCTWYTFTYKFVRNALPNFKLSGIGLNQYLKFFFMTTFSFDWMFLKSCRTHISLYFIKLVLKTHLSDLWVYLFFLFIFWSVDIINTVVIFVYLSEPL